MLKNTLQTSPLGPRPQRNNEAFTEMYHSFNFAQSKKRLHMLGDTAAHWLDKRPLCKLTACVTLRLEFGGRSDRDSLIYTSFTHGLPK